jgi:hypothetical protein
MGGMAPSRPHAVVVPYPASGNINPALHLAKLLHRHGVYVTFVNTEHNHRRAQAAGGAGAVRGREDFRFEAIPDGLVDADRVSQDYGRSLSLSLSLSTSQAASAARRCCGTSSRGSTARRACRPCPAWCP